MEFIFKYFFRRIPNEITRVGIEFLQKNIRQEINLLELELGVVIKIFVLGSSSSSIVEVISIQSIDNLSDNKYQTIIKKIEKLEKNEFYLVSLKTISRLAIKDMGLMKRATSKADEILFTLNNGFEDWADYYFILNKENKKYTLKLNNNIDEYSVAFIGKYFDIETINSYENFLELKLYEQLWQDSKVLGAIRENGYCYSTIAKFHEKLNIFMIGTVSEYTNEKSIFIKKNMANFVFSTEEVKKSKEKLKQNFLIASSINHQCFTLLPFWIYNKEVRLENIIESINELDIAGLHSKFLSSRFVCTRAVEDDSR